MGVQLVSEFEILNSLFRSLIEKTRLASNYMIINHIFFEY